MTEILVPVPMHGRTTLFNNANISGQKQATLNNWSAGIVDTRYGKMVSFRTSGPTLHNVGFDIWGSLVDINAPVSDRQNLTGEIMAAPLSPILDDTADNYAVSSSFLKTKGKIYNKSSYIYLDEGLKSASADQVISIYVSFSMAEGSPNIQQGIGSNYFVIVEENIPADVRGWIPVTVQSDHPIG